MSIVKFKWKWICTALVIGMLTAGCSWADGGRHYRPGKHSHGHHYVAPKPHGQRHHAPPRPTRHATKHTRVTHVYNYTPAPPAVYVPAQPLYPAPPAYYGGTLLSAVIGAPGVAVGFSIAGR